MVSLSEARSVVSIAYSSTAIARGYLILSYRINEVHARAVGTWKLLIKKKSSLLCYILLPLGMIRRRYFGPMHATIVAVCRFVTFYATVDLVFAPSDKFFFI